MLVVSVGRWGWCCQQLSFLVFSCSKFRGVVFPPVIRSNPWTPLGKQCFCSAVVLDSFLYVYVVGCTLFSARPLCCWVKLPILEWFVFWDHPPSPYSCKNKSVVGITLQIWEKFSIGSCCAIGVRCVFIPVFSLFLAELQPAVTCMDSGWCCLKELGLACLLPSPKDTAIWAAAAWAGMLGLTCCHRAAPSQCLRSASAPWAGGTSAFCPTALLTSSLWAGH